MLKKITQDQRVLEQEAEKIRETVERLDQVRVALYVGAGMNKSRLNDGKEQELMGQLDAFVRDGEELAETLEQLGERATAAILNDMVPPDERGIEWERTVGAKVARIIRNAG